jgi:hypothetical protein
MLFPSRVEYLTFVKQEKGNNELARRSGGFYSPGDRECWFFWDGLERTLDVLYHEVAHQLFEETRTGVNRNSGQVWPVEGIATYMETWEKVDGKWKPGHRVTGNLKMAKDFLAGGTAFSLRAYLATEEQEFHKEPQRGRNYALGGALCHFFLHGQDEIYRESFVAFLRDYYSGTARGDSLFEYIEVEGASGPAKLPAIEKQFREHMASLTGTAKDAPTETEKPAEKEDEN